MKIAVIIQCRMESTRLWGKILLPIYYHNASNLSILEAMLHRLKYIEIVDDIILAMPDSPYSNLIQYNTLSFKPKIKYYRGSMDDVLSRTLNAAIENDTDIIVDVTSDCPLVDPTHIKHMVNKLIKYKFDYISNIDPRMWPDGCDIQVYKRETLEKVEKITEKKEHRQHSGWNILQNPNGFNISSMKAPEKYTYPELALTLDTPEDYLLLTMIYKHFTMIGKDLRTPIEEIIDYVLTSEQILNINKNIKRKIPGKGDSFV